MEYTEILMTIISSVVVPAVIILGKALYQYIQDNIKDKNVQKYLMIATDCVTDAVADVAQTYIDKLGDEEWNDETKSQAFEIAKTKAITHLGITGEKLLEEVLGDFDDWINSKIQAEVKRMAVK